MSQAHPGSTVHVRGEDWLVARVDAYERCTVLTLDGGASRRPLRIIEPFDRPRLRRVKFRRSHPRLVMRAALGAIRHARPPAGLWTAAAAAIDLLPFQLEPALAVLQGATRVLLADSVGLGKTIEAGLILSELRARGWAERALILCPAGLRAMWAGELQQRFNIACAVFDQAAIAETTASLPPGVNPWTGHAVLVSSIDLAKRDEVRAALSEVPFDVLIADEAHHLTPGTDRGEIVNGIASRTPWCIFVSATPHSGDEAAFAYLAGLGSHGEALTIFHRRPHQAGRRRDRRERIVRVHASGSERDALRAVDAYARAIWHDRGAHDPAVQLIAVTIARRAASSPFALRRTLIRRLSLLSSSPEHEQPLLPWAEQDSADDDPPATVLGRAGFTDGASERATIERLVALLDHDGSTKFRWLIRFLARAAEPAIVFTEYRDTVDALLAALPPSLRVVSISGAHAPAARKMAVDAFNRGDADVLVATDTAGEGLNLHHRCRLVVDMELPWNPIRLEQRLGRVDRLGQARRVHAIRLVHAGSIEERVLDRIRERRAVSDSEVARWVFQGEPGEPGQAWSPRSATVPAVAAEVERLARQRAVRSPQSGHVARGMREDGRFIAVHRITHTNALGSVVAQCAVAHAVDRGAGHRIDHAIGARIREQCAEIDQALTPLRSAAAERIARIRNRIADARSHSIQRSLFDDRAEIAARRADAVLSRLDAALARRQISVASPATSAGAISTLVAAWPHRRP
jgi:superfamily II DNA or RNA helicase